MTFSLTTTGVPADQEQQVATLRIEDAYAAAGAQANAMANGSTVLCRGPDGSTQYYRFDAERSRPGAPVLLPI